VKMLPLPREEGLARDLPRWYPFAVNAMAVESADNRHFFVANDSYGRHTVGSALA
jgi:hypothetical protein